MKKQANDLNKEIMESYYRYIAHSHVENIIDALDEDEKVIDQVQLSKENEKWFEKYIDKIKSKEKKIKRKKLAKKYSIRAATFLMAIVLSVSLLTVSVEGFRVKVFNMFLEKNEKFTSIEFEESSNTNITDIADWDYYYPSYLPEGYTLVEKSVFNQIKVLKFSNGSSEILFNQGSIGSTLHVDTEDALTSEVLVNNEESILVEKNDRKTLLWHNSDSSFYIISRIDVNELLKIANSITK